MPKVSVIIPTYNYGHFLGEAIQSVLDQTFTDFEVIVVDDGSTDNTKEVVGRFKDPRIRYMYQENRGGSAAQNAGIKASSGEYIAFLDADDTWLPQNLELKVKVLDSRPDIGLVCSDTYVFDDQTGVNLGRVWHDKPFRCCVNPRKAAQQPLKAMLSQEGCFIRLPMTVVRRQVFSEVGYFDESLRNNKDWDMFVRIVQRIPIETIDMPLARRRKHGAALTSSRDRVYAATLVVFNKALHSYSLSSADLMLVKRRLARTHFEYGKGMVVNGKIHLGRQKLLTAIRVNPWCVRPYIYLALSLLGNGSIQTLKSWKKQLEWRF